MCEAVVVDSSPENVTLTVSRCVAASYVTTVVPVPGDAFGGDSAGPVSVPVSVTPQAATENSNAVSQNPLAARRARRTTSWKLKPVGEHVLFVIFYPFIDSAFDPD